MRTAVPVSRHLRGQHRALAGSLRLRRQLKASCEGVAGVGALRTIVTEFDTLVSMQQQTVKLHADNKCFGTKNQETKQYEWMTYAEWGEKVEAFSSALKHFGVDEGDRVAIISNNRVEWAIASFATYHRGGVYVPMYEAQLQKDWEFILEDSGAKVLLCANMDIYEKVKGLAGKHGQLERVIYIDGPYHRDNSFEGLLNRGENGEFGTVAPYLAKPYTLASLIYTSGTTGRPKGVELTHENLSSNVTGLRPIFPNWEELITGDDVSLAFLPWAHCYGQNCELHSLLAAGTGIGIAEGVDKLLDNLSEVRPTVLFSVPTLFKRVFDGVQNKMAEESSVRRSLFQAALSAGRDMRRAKESGTEPGFLTAARHAVLDRLVLGKIRERMGGRLRMAFAGGAATPRDVLEFFEDIGVPINEGYGLTETSPLVVVNALDYPMRKLGTAGFAVEGVDVRILVDGREVAEGEEGEICVSGPNVMRGYRNNDAANAEVFMEFDGKRFFRTGDMGALDAMGRLSITGRLKEQYKLENGKYVVPGPLEEALCTSSFVQQAVVWGDNRPYNIALIVPDRAVFDPWVRSNLPHLEGKPWSVVSKDPRVVELFDAEIEAVVARKVLKKYEVPRKYYLVENAWTSANGFLTPKMSIKRHVVFKTFKQDIEDLYAAGDERVAKQEEQAERIAA